MCFLTHPRQGARTSIEQMEKSDINEATWKEHTLGVRWSWIWWAFLTYQLSEFWAYFLICKCGNLPLSALSCSLNEKTNKSIRSSAWCITDTKIILPSLYSPFFPSTEVQLDWYERERDREWERERSEQRVEMSQREVCRSTGWQVLWTL